MMTRPRFANFTSFWISLWVPITMSMPPEARPSRDFATSLGLRNRESSAIRTGKPEKRSLKLPKCCSASSVVGTRIATCLPAATAMKAARIATSVLPKPTSPQTRRSIGRPSVMSTITDWIASAWSGVSSNGKVAAKLSYSWTFSGKANPSRARRLA